MPGFIRYATYQIPAVASLATVASSGLATVDDNQERRVTGVYSSMQVKNLKVRVVVAGKQVVDIDSSMFAAAQGPIPVFARYAKGIQFELDFVSVVAGVVEAANTDEIVVRYEVDQEAPGAT